MSFVSRNLEKLSGEVLTSLIMVTIKFYIVFKTGAVFKEKT